MGHSERAIRVSLLTLAFAALWGCPSDRDAEIERLRREKAEAETAAARAEASRLQAELALERERAANPAAAVQPGPGLSVRNDPGASQPPVNRNPVVPSSTPVSVGCLIGDERAWSPSWSPNGGYLAYTSGRGYTEAGGRGHEVWIVRADGGGKRRLAFHPGVDSCYPAWHPGGQWVVYARNRAGGGDLWEVKIDGGEERQITSDPDPWQELRARWNADGDTLGVVKGHDWTCRTNPHHVWLIRRRDGIPESSRDCTPSISSRVTWLAWDPGSRFIAFSQGEGHDEDIYCVDLAQGSVASLVVRAGMDAQPDWSPDGTHILFASNHGGVERIWMLRLSDRRLSPVDTIPPGSNSPSWSPDGQFVAYVRQQKIWLVSSAGIVPPEAPDGSNKVRGETRGSARKSEPPRATTLCAVVTDTKGGTFTLENVDIIVQRLLQNRTLGNTSKASVVHTTKKADLSVERGSVTMTILLSRIRSFSVKTITGIEYELRIRTVEGEEFDAKLRFERQTTGNNYYSETTIDDQSLHGTLSGSESTIPLIGIASVRFLMK